MTEERGDIIDVNSHKSKSLGMQKKYFSRIQIYYLGNPDVSEGWQRSEGL